MTLACRLIYWTKSDPLLGQAKAGPAILLTERSPLTRIEFGDRPEGIVFRGMPGFDVLPGQAGAVNPDPVCETILNYPTLADAHAGPLMEPRWRDPGRAAGAGVPGIADAQPMTTTEAA